MSPSPTWIAANRPSEREFAELVVAARAACEFGVEIFDMDALANPDITERRVIENLTVAIEKVIDTARDLDIALTASLEGALPVDRVVDAEVAEAGPF